MDARWRYKNRQFNKKRPNGKLLYINYAGGFCCLWYATDKGAGGCSFVSFAATNIFVNRIYSQTCRVFFRRGLKKKFGTE